MQKNVPVRLRKDSSVIIDTGAAPIKFRSPDSTFRTDTSVVPITDTFNVKYSKDTLEAPINYEAADSGVLLVKEKKFILYGKTKTTYTNVELTAPTVVLDQASNTISAFGAKDTLGRVLERAVFQQAEQSFQSDTIRFNLKSKRGITTNTYTKQQDFFVQSATIKQVDSVTTFARDVIFTTCEYDDPHFGFKAKKGKFIRNKVAITGPITPQFEGITLPITLPFGIFPLSQGRHSGLLRPTFAVYQELGLSLQGLGYYHVLNDNLDMLLKADVYSYGSWAAHVTPTYRKRYRYSGSLGLNYSILKQNFKGDPDFGKQNILQITWNHNVDPKARPGTTFGANVSLGSSRFNSYTMNDPQRNISNQQNSSINYSRIWAGKPFALSMAANESQNSNDGSFNVSLPTGTFTVNTLYPLERKTTVGEPRWYEKLGIGYTTSFSNVVNFRINDTTHPTFREILDTAAYGLTHSVPITLSLPSLGPIMVAPFLSYSENWFKANRISRVWNSNTESVDTIASNKGFYTDRQISFGIGLNTTIYGTKFFRKGSIRGIRHTIRPNISANYQPNLSKGKYDVIQVSKSGSYQPLSQFYGPRAQPYGYGRFGGISFGIDNNVEMKIKRAKDTAARNVKLIDGFGINGSYNFLKDSLKLSDLNINFRTTLFEKVSITANANLNPYSYDYYGNVVNTLGFLNEDRFKLGSITYVSVGLNTQFQSKPRDPKQQNTVKPVRDITDPALLADQERLKDYMARNPSEFVDFNIPWTINLSYSLTYNHVPDSAYRFRNSLTSGVTFNGSFSLTEKWNISGSGGLDLNTGQLGTVSMSINRNLHCWQMGISVTPLGNYRYFSVNISPTSQLLQSLRINRTRTFSNF